MICPGIFSDEYNEGVQSLVYVQADTMQICQHLSLVMLTYYANLIMTAAKMKLGNIKRNLIDIYAYLVWSTKP